jgi:hypothetical protein
MEMVATPGGEGMRRWMEATAGDVGLSAGFRPNLNSNKRESEGDTG